MAAERRPLGALAPEISHRPPGPSSRAFMERLARVESRDVTFRSDDWPIFWEEASGANVVDADGNVYVDLTAAFGVALLGHGHPSVVEAVRTQVGRLIHGMGDVHPPTVKLELLERLTELAPWPAARAVLASTGAEAVEIALKTAWLATGRPGILAFEGGYHGLTLGALATTARSHFRRPFEGRLYSGVAFAPFPVKTDDHRLGLGAEDALEVVREMLARGAPNGDPIGTVLVEPVQGRAGARIPPPGFMAVLSDVAREAGALVVADEVMTGIGRCGVFLASRKVGLEPDLVCLGKALGGGMPVSACVGPASVMDAWPESRGEAVHTSTFLGHPTACAASLAVLDVVEREAVPRRAELLGGRLVEGLRQQLDGVAGVSEVRGLGLLLGVELAGVDGAPRPGAAVRVAEAALAEGVLVLPSGDEGHVVELTPPVCLGEEQAGIAVDVLSAAIREVVR